MNKDDDVVILCGGKGTRLYPLTLDVPKPMVRIGDIPVLEHVIRYCRHYGFRNFKLLVGYKGEVIRSYFHGKYKDLNIECLDTGEDSDTAERIWQVKDILSSVFLLSYADVLSDVDLGLQMAFHRRYKKVGTMAVVPLRTSYGVVELDGNDLATDYEEKPVFTDKWMNAGIFIFNSELFDYWDRENTDFSRGMLVKLAGMGLLSCFKHYGFWSGMDTVRENEILNELWKTGEAKWVFCTEKEPLSQAQVGLSGLISPKD